MKYLILFMLTILSPHLFAKNYGHRLGGDIYSHLPENSLAVYRESILHLMEHEKYLYSEFDIRETLDGKLAVFHDKTLARMAPWKMNQAQYEQLIQLIKKRRGKKYSYKKIKLEWLNYDELKELRLKGDLEQTVPLLVDILNLSLEEHAFRPLVVEIKLLKTKEAKLQLLEQLSEFKEVFQFYPLVFAEKYDFPGEFPITLLAFKKHFKNSFKTKEDKIWFCRKVQELGLGGVFQAGKHHKNLCESYLSIYPFLQQ